jgi:hypothetical protein
MIIGDIVAFAGALGGVVYVEQGKALRQEVCILPRSIGSISGVKLLHICSL